jgi:hypothetical protein
MVAARPALGYRIDFSGRSVVLSGDTSSTGRATSAILPAQISGWLLSERQ